jgi:hypothetical protein
LDQRALLPTREFGTEVLWGAPPDHLSFGLEPVAVEPQVKR